MRIQVPNFVEQFLLEIQQKHGTEVLVREPLTMGKSGAFVAIVDCTGTLDGIHILKVDVIPTGWDGEEARHKEAISYGAFSKKIPEIALSIEADKRYCMLIKLAGQSRIEWRPLVADHTLFRSAYTEFSKICWTPNLFSLGEQMPFSELITPFWDTNYRRHKAVEFTLIFRVSFRQKSSTHRYSLFMANFCQTRLSSPQLT